jgi:lipoprotein-anchoring transpeptidase ErfK/SrfK
VLGLACAAEHPSETGQRSATAAKGAPIAATSASASAPASTPSGASLAASSSPAQRPVPSHDDGAPRVHAKTRFVWIRSEPDVATDWIGFLWTGGSTKLKSKKPRPGPGCETWYEVEPRGWVCVDGRRVTLDGNDPVLAAVRAHGADLTSPRPHRYGESIGLQRYDALPTPEIQKMRERGFETHQERVTLARGGTNVDALRGVDLALPSEAPPTFPAFVSSVHEGRLQLTPRSTVAYSREAVWEGRGFLLAGDYTWVPKDRVKPYAPVTFQGTPLEKVKLPLAFARGGDRPLFRRSGTGDFVAAEEKLRRLTWEKLTGENVESGGERYLALERGGLYIKARDAVVPVPRGRTPWGDAVGSGKRMNELPKGRRTWLEVSIRGGWLIAYEDTTPVYATMISAGRGGEPVEGRDTLETASTPTGSFPINGKFATATMEAPGEFVHSDVPWVQNLVGPYALHTAYWHDNWGNLMSAGCVNVSPDDAKWLYEFTEPAVPPGWHSVRWIPREGASTLVVIHG